MLRVSLHKIAFAACYGLYASEQEIPNDFEVDVDVTFDMLDPPFLDYVLVHAAVRAAFSEIRERQTLEHAALHIQQSVRQLAGESAAEVRVAVRKLRPPIDGQVAYSEVCVGER